MSLDGSSVLVTGGTRGIGLAIALRLVRDGASRAVLGYLGVELAPRIRVNAVSGGVVETGALEHFPNKEAMLRSVERTPAGRLVEPEDIAGAVSFLCSADAAMVCGQTLIVDGGHSLPA